MQEDVSPELFRHKGLICGVMLNRLGVWCGYAGVPVYHPLFGKTRDYFDIFDIIKKESHVGRYQLKVHGGVTFTGHLRKGCDDWWFFGFDCGHYMDYIPALAEAYIQIKALGPLMNDMPEHEFRTKAYATAETKSMAEQLRRIEDEYKRRSGR